MAVRKITKTLATMEDLACGIGKVQQQRGASKLTLGKIDLPYAVIDVNALKALDTSKFTSATLNNTKYVYSSTDASGVKPNVGSGSWLVAPASTNDLAKMAELDTKLLELLVLGPVAPQDGTSLVISSAVPKDTRTVQLEGKLYELTSAVTEAGEVTAFSTSALTIAISGKTYPMRDKIGDMRAFQTDLDRGFDTGISKYTKELQEYIESAGARHNLLVNPTFELDYEGDKDYDADATVAKGWKATTFVDNLSLVKGQGLSAASGSIYQDVPKSFASLLSAAKLFGSIIDQGGTQRSAAFVTDGGAYWRFTIDLKDLPSGASKVRLAGLAQTKGPLQDINPTEEAVPGGGGKTGSVVFAASSGGWGNGTRIDWSAKGKLSDFSFLVVVCAVKSKLVEGTWTQYTPLAVPVAEALAKRSIGTAFGYQSGIAFGGLVSIAETSALTQALRTGGNTSPLVNVVSVIGVY